MSTPHSKTSFRLTANMVTIARIMLLPLPCLLLLYGNIVAWWFAFVVFTLLGATDFVDGMMARKEGPTRLGALIDPAADKIFIAAVMIALTAVEFFPVWALCAIMSREYLVSALRSSVALRKETVTTSKLAKLKTIYQMGGFGTIFMTYAFPLPLLWVSAYGIFAVLAGIGLDYYFRRKKTVPFWIAPVSGAFLMVATLPFFMDIRSAIMVQLVIIVALTWVSALDYIKDSYAIFRRTGFYRYDAIRAFWVMAHGLCVLVTVPFFPQYALLILLSTSCEFALGGIDNVVAEQSDTRSKPFLITASAGLLYWVFAFSQAHMLLPVLGLASTSLIVLGVMFQNWRHLFAKAF